MNDAERLAALEGLLGVARRNLDGTFTVVSTGGVFTGPTLAAAIDGALAPPALSVLIVPDGVPTPYDFHEKDGADAGTFEGHDFRQRCLRDDRWRATFPMTVDFRRDEGTGRREVVFHWGRFSAYKDKAFDPRPVAYRADIYEGVTLLASIRVDRHNWHARWRYNPTPRPVRGELGDLLTSWVDSGCIPLELDPDLTRLAKRPADHAYNGCNDNAGLNKSFNTTGDRDEIGPLTEHGAYYLATGDPVTLTTVLAQGEAAGSFPWHFLDDAQSCPADVYRYPVISCGERAPGNPALPYVRTIPSDWRLDMAHASMPSLLPYLLTGDPYHLEEIGYAANYGLMLDAGRTKAEGLPIVTDGQVRAHAWGLRNLALAAKLTPDNVPSHMLPGGYFRRALSDERTYYTRRYVKGTSPTFAVLHAFNPPSDGGYNDALLSCFQMDFLAFVTGWVVRMGFVEWEDAWRWTAYNSIYRSGGPSPDDGDPWTWPYQACSPYLLPLFHPLPADPTKADLSRPIASRKEAYESALANPAIGGIMDPLPPEPRFGQTLWPGYEQYTAGALALAASAGLTGAAEGLARCRAMALDGYNRNRHPILCRWAYRPA